MAVLLSGCVSFVRPTPIFLKHDQALALDSAQMAWGTSQLQSMLKDRPAMAPYVRPGDPLWNWTVDQFAGEYASGEVRWDPGSPEGSFESVAGHPDPAKNQKGYIQVTADHTLKYFHTSQAKTAPILWYEAAIELCNLKNERLFDAIQKDANEGLIGPEDFAFESMAVEDVVTNGDMYDFFYKVWIPNCNELSLPFRDENFTQRFGSAVGKGWEQRTFLRYFYAMLQNQQFDESDGIHQLIVKDLKAHFDYYVDCYKRTVKPYLESRGQSVPQEVLTWDARKFFLDQLE